MNDYALEHPEVGRARAARQQSGCDEREVGNKGMTAAGGRGVGSDSALREAERM